MIQAETKSCITLGGYLYETDIDYKREADLLAVRLAAEKGRYVGPRSTEAFCQPELYNLRVQFWERFIANLEADNL